MRKKLPTLKEKPWGHEIWFAWTDQYAGKILHIKKGHRYSLQYHEKKSETQYVLSGILKITLGKNRGTLKNSTLNAGDKIDIPAKTIHRAEALEDALILEVSTPELDDVVKLEDDYGRAGIGNNELQDRRIARRSKSCASLRMTKQA